MSRLDKALIGFDSLEDPRLLDLDRGVRLLHIEALVWSARHRTDGVITRGGLRWLTDEADAALAAAQLVSAGLWTSTDDGWQIVDYTREQISAQDAARIEETNAAKWRRQKQHQRGLHDLCDIKWCKSLRVDSTADKRADSRTSNRIDSTRLHPPKGGSRVIEAEPGANGGAPSPSWTPERAQATLDNPSSDDSSKAAARAVLELAATYGKSGLRVVRVVQGSGVTEPTPTGPSQPAPATKRADD